MIDDIEELKTLIIQCLDVTDLLDILGMDVGDLVEKLEEEIEQHADVLRKAVS